MSTLTRRELIHLGTMAGAAACLPSCASGPVRIEPNRAYLRLGARAAPGVVGLAMTAEPNWRAACEQVVSRVSDLSWLKRGDSVFVKVASNSGNPHPAVTAPQAVTALVALLRDAGAGRVIVGDQAGAEHVRSWQGGRRSSTRRMFERNGLLGAIEECRAELHCFDDRPWEESWQPQLDFANHWNGQLFLPAILQHVDHVIVLPRLGAHALAGYSCAAKAAVGWLRDDSRLALHSDGTSFFQRIAEINHAPPLRDKLRLVVTLVHEALVNIGPDIGSTIELPGCLALASTSLVDHDALASLLLLYLRERAGFSLYDLYQPYPEHVNYWNRRFIEQSWGVSTADNYRMLVPSALGQGIEHDALLSQLAALQGHRVDPVQVALVADPLPRELVSYLRTAGAGMVQI